MTPISPLSDLPRPVPVCRLFGLDIQADTLVGASQAILAHASADARPAAVVVTPNVDHLVKLEKQPALKARYAQADGIYADGMPLVWTSRWLGARPLPERVTGADLFVTLAEGAAARQLPVFVIGGMPGRAGSIADAMRTRFPGLVVEVYAPSMQFDPTGAEGEEAVARINRARPALVFTCLGFPKQELWALAHRERLSASAVLCVGAALEFALGEKRRAPLWMQRGGMEWIWRLASEPRRLWRRYLVQSLGFVGMLWRERAARRVPGG